MAEVRFRPGGARGGPGGGAGGAVLGFVLGILLFCVSVPLLWLNEWNSVQNYNALREVEANLVKNTPARNDKEMVGKLVHMQGPLKGRDLEDRKFGVKVENALILRRGTEMYQWVEEEEPNETGDERFTSYVHRTEWARDYVNTDTFRDEHAAALYKNPTRPGALRTFEERARAIEVGQVKTSAEFSSNLVHLKPLDIKHKGDKETISRSVVVVNKIPRDHVLRHVCDGSACRGVIYSTAKAAVEPKVGDMRISFEYAPAGGIASLIGLKTKSGIAPYVARNGRSIALASRGKVDAEELLQGAVTENTAWTWLMRGGGILLSFVGLLLILSPINALASYMSFVPLLGSLVGGLVGMAVFAVALMGSLSCSIIVIAVAWLYYRPLLSVAALIMGFGGLYLSSRWARAGKQPGKEA